MSFFFGPGGMGGMPGMGGGMPGGDDDEGESSSNTAYYELLGLEKNATEREIKKKYRKLAREVHPDKHPDEQEKYHAKFTELQKAYEVLSDPSKRKMYDRYGEAGLKGGGGGFGGSHSDIFDMFFGGGGHGHRGGGRGQQRRKKAPMIRAFLDVTLEDLYIGTSKEVAYEKMSLCNDCGGKGGKKVVECSTCNGNGVQIVMKRMGYMTVQQQRECPKCHGEGTSIPESLKCKKCVGKGLKKSKKKIDFIIPRGSKHAEKIVIAGKGHEIPDAANGDVVVVLRLIKHDTFQRIGADLAMNQKISLKQALCGFTVYINHLSGYKLKLKSEPKEVISHHELKAVYGKGMPQKGSSNTFGHLYVKFEIVFPDEIDEDTRKLLFKLLPKGDKEVDPAQYEKEEKEKEKKHQEKIEKMKLDGGNDEDFDDEYDYEVHEMAETVHGEPKVTPASARSAYDEDEEDTEGSGCRQM